jgi:hypothetical protein
MLYIYPVHFTVIWYIFGILCQENLATPIGRQLETSRFVAAGASLPGNGIAVENVSLAYKERARAIEI